MRLGPANTVLLVVVASAGFLFGSMVSRQTARTPASGMPLNAGNTGAELFDADGRPVELVTVERILRESGALPAASVNTVPSNEHQVVAALAAGAASTGRPTPPPPGIALMDYPPRVPMDPTKDLPPITYDTCVASLANRSKVKTLQRRIHWLHFPKCGTSFGAVIYGYLCQQEEAPYVSPATGRNPGAECTYCGRKGKNSVKPTIWDPHLRKLIPFTSTPEKPGLEYCDWSVPVPHFPFTNHFAMTWDWKKKNYLDAPIALFRDPRKRVVSAWNNNKHSFGIGTFHNPHNKSYARQLINEIQSVDAFSAYPPIQSCQTKMLLGEYCGEYLNISHDMMDEALRRVMNMEFVGLTDAFNASVCLWHHQFGGVPQEWMFQSVGKVRSSKFLFEQTENAKAKGGVHLDPDPLPGGGNRVLPAYFDKIPIENESLDWQVYQLASKLFVSRLQKFGLWHPDYKAMKVICRGKKGPTPPC